MSRVEKEVWDIQSQTSRIVNRISEIKAEIERIKLQRPALAKAEIDLSELRPLQESDIYFLYKRRDSSDDSSDAEDIESSRLEKTKSMLYFFPDGTYTSIRNHRNEIKFIQMLQKSYFQMTKSGETDQFRLDRSRYDRGDDIFAPFLRNTEASPPEVPPRKFDVHDSISGIEFGDIFNPYGYFMERPQVRETKQPPEEVITAIKRLQKIPDLLTGAKMAELSMEQANTDDDSSTIIRLPSLNRLTKKSDEITDTVN